MEGSDPRTSVVTVAYESGPALTRLLESLAGEADEVIVVNTGPPAEEVEAAAGSARVIEPGVNLGYAGGANLGAREATGDVLVFLNPDTVARPGAVAALAARAAEPDVGLAMARLLLLDRPDTLNSSGNVLHLSGMAWAGGYGQPAESLREVRDVAYPSGAAMAIRRDLFLELGGFSDELFMYQEDLELAWRARLRGLRIVVDPAADVLHDYRIMDYVDCDYLEARRDLFAAAAMVVIDATLSEEALECVFDLADDYEVPVCVDPTSPALAARLCPFISRMYMVSPNSAETTALCGMADPAHDHETAINTARHLVLLGARIAVVTLGARGLAYADGSGGGFISALHTRVVDPTGAGDAFSGAVIFGLLNEVSLDEAMRLGVTAASLTLQSTHTVLPNLSQELLYEQLAI